MSDLWWPKFIRKPRLRLRLPQFRAVRLPVKWVLFAIVLVVYYFVVSGGMFTLSYVPPPFGSSGGEQLLLLWPGVSRQFLLEGVVGGIMYLVGFIGFYFMYHSTRHIYRPRYSQMLLAIGIVLILVSFLTCQFMITEKIRLQTS
jgi:hypothetical protein